MSEIRALIEQLVAAGVDPIEAAEIVTRAALHGAANAPKQRSAGAIRQERYRRNKASQVTESDAGDDLSSPEGSSPTPPSPKPLQSIPPSPPKGGSSPTDRAIEVFSAQASKAGLPVPRKVTADRRRKVEARIREHGEELWAEACRRMANSAFCRGDNDRGWRADLDFLCQPKSFNGLIEGKYDDRPHRQSQAPPQKTAFQLHQEAFAKELDRTINGNDRYDDRPDNVVDLAATDYRYSGTPSPVRR
ncbi:DNA replication protein [Sinorhizobium meliloti]|nr:DNA replication protein [Sinorhizobium meliloti]